MKSLFLVALLAAAATAAVVSNEVLDVADGDEMADVDVNEMPEAVVTDVTELIDVSELSDEAEFPAQTAVATRRNLIVGTVGFGDRLHYHNEVSANGVLHHVHVRDVTVYVNGRITAVRVVRLGASQNATPSILSGGVGTTAVTVRIRSDRGRGYHYAIQVYGI